MFHGCFCATFFGHDGDRCRDLFKLVNVRVRVFSAWKYDWVMWYIAYKLLTYCIWRPCLYNLCLCLHVFISLTVYLHSRRGVLLKDYHCGDSLSGAQKSVFFPWLDASQPLSFYPPLYFPFLQSSVFLSPLPYAMKWEGMGSVSTSNGGVIVSMSCLSLCVGPDPSCRAVTAVRGWDAKTCADLSRGK